MLIYRFNATFEDKTNFSKQYLQYLIGVLENLDMAKSNKKKAGLCQKQNLK